MAGAGIRGLATRQWTPVDELAHHAKAPAPTTKAEILRLWDEVTDQIGALWPQIPAQRFDEIDTAFGQYEGRVSGLFLYWIDNEVHHRARRKCTCGRWESSRRRFTTGADLSLAEPVHAIDRPDRRSCLDGNVAGCRSPKRTRNSLFGRSCCPQCVYKLQTTGSRRSSDN